MSTPPPIALAAAPSSPRKASDAPEQMRRAVPELHGRFRAQLVAAPRVDGSRLVAVLRDGSRAFDLAVALSEAVWPLELCCVAVSQIRNEGREAVRRAEDKAIGALDLTMRDGIRFRFAVAGRSPEECALAEACALLHATIAQEWTPTRAGAVRAYRRLGRQKEVAAELQVTQQAVSQMLRGARFRELASVEDKLRRWLSRSEKPGLWPLRRPVSSELVANS